MHNSKQISGYFTIFKPSNLTNADAFTQLSLLRSLKSEKNNIFIAYIHTAEHSNILGFIVIPQNKNNLDVHLDTLSPHTVTYITGNLSLGFHSTSVYTFVIQATSFTVCLDVIYRSPIPPIIVARGALIRSPSCARRNAYIFYDINRNIFTDTFHAMKAEYEYECFAMKFILTLNLHFNRLYRCLFPIPNNLQNESLADHSLILCEIMAMIKDINPARPQQYILLSVTYERSSTVRCFLGEC